MKTVHSSSKGKVKAKVKATKDGYYRFGFSGDSRTAVTVSGSDYINVK